MLSKNLNLYLGESIKDPLLVIDKEGNIQFQNNSAEDILTSNHLSRKLAIKSTLINNWEQIYRLFSKNRDSFQVIPIENDLNEIVHLSADILCFNTSELFLVRIINMTSEVQFHSNQLKSFQNLTTIFDEFNKPLIITDKAGAIIKMNDSFVDLFKGIDQFEELAQFDQLFDAFKYEMRDLIEYYHSIGEKKFGELSIHLKQNPNLQLKLLSIYYMELNLLITTISNVEKEKAMDNPLHMGMRVLGESTAKILHEINNPLATLKGYFELIRKKGEFNGSYLSIIQGELGRIESLITDLLYLANPKSNLYKPINIVDVIEQVIQLFEMRLQTSDCTLLFKLKVPDYTYVYGNELRLKQVLINLMKNSIEALDSQKGQREIELQVDKKFDMISIKIKDNGPGITEETLAKIFQPFFTTKEEGTGLGLSITKQLIEEHNGTLDVSSNLNKGTTFTIKLPEYSFIPSEMPLIPNELN